MAAARSVPLRLASTFTGSLRRPFSISRCIRADEPSSSSPPAPEAHPASSPQFNSLADAPGHKVLRVIADSLPAAATVGGRVTKGVQGSTPPSSSNTPDSFKPASLSQMNFLTQASSPRTPIPPIPSRKPSSQPEGYFYIHVHSMTRNCIITICDHNHNPLLVSSGGRLGIRHTRRGTPEAAFSVTVAAFEKFASKGYKAKAIEIVYKGLGKPRDGFVNAISSQQGEAIRQKVVRVTDATPVWKGGHTLPNPKRR